MNDKISNIVSVFENNGVEDLRNYASEDMWRNDPEKALLLSIKRSNIFDEKYYLLHNPDVKKNIINPVYHFVKYGYEEKRNFKILSKRRNNEKLFSIVTACYNVEEYLDDYFNSLVNQSIKFKEYIYCIMVDDGSTDKTSEKIKYWVKKYPNNIKYIYKKNGGQSSARNLGLKYAKSKWITFIDSDDFVNNNYFKNVLEQINNEIILVGTHLVNYIENNNKYIDNEPLSGIKFKKNINLLKVADIKWEIQQSVASAFFLLSKIKHKKILFNEKCKPNFEDSLFIIDYLRDEEDNNVLYLNDSEYYYRKRGEKSSTVNHAWKCKEMYNDVFLNGYIPLLRDKKITNYSKRSILYSLSWHIEYVLDNEERINFLTAEEKANYYKFIKYIISFYDEDFIFSLNRPGFNFFLKTGIINCFNNSTINRKVICYIIDIDLKTEMIKLKYYNGQICKEEFYANSNIILPEYDKIVTHKFLNNNFAIERNIWLSTKGKHEIKAIIDNKPAYFSFNGKLYNKINIDIIKNIHFSNKIYENINEWILLDRESQADDNSEHLYRWIKKYHPEIKLYFVLMKDSPDWKRLDKENFNLIEYKSDKYFDIIKKCDKVISSSISDTVYDFKKLNQNKFGKFIFLQHGVTQNDISNWLNREKIDMIISVTNDENNAFLSNDRMYSFTKKEVVKAGFPRFDSLLTNNDIKNIILITPTWRKYLVGDIIKGDLRSKSKNFKNSEWLIEWRNILNSDKLKTIIDKNNYKIVFFCHPNIQEYIEDFIFNKYIIIKTYKNSRIQDYLKISKLMITDYSSVAFDFAYMKKPIIYYQFDYESFYSGEHTLKKGYFDYSINGFGPVAKNKSELLKYIDTYLENKCKNEYKYTEKILNTFIKIDNKNCERVFSEIIRI